MVESNTPGEISTNLLEDSRESITQPPDYDGSATRNGDVLAIWGEIEAAHTAFVLECVSNSALGEYPYLEQLS